MRDYYDILDVPQDATEEQIRTAYRFHIKAFHPDKFAPETDHARNAQRRTEEIIEAYGVLSKPHFRAEYDRFRKYTGTEHAAQSSEAVALGRKGEAQRSRKSRFQISRNWKGIFQPRVVGPIAALILVSLVAWLLRKQQPQDRNDAASVVTTPPIAAAVSPSPAMLVSKAPPSDSIAEIGVPYESPVDFMKYATKLREQALLKVEPQIFAPSTSRTNVTRFPWKTSIVTTVSWIGEKGNTRSAWDANWTSNYGGFDSPDSGSRRNYIPVSFVPRQNPFYCALPYNDVTHGQFKPEAALVIPWFRQSYTEPGRSVCKDRWLAIRKGNRTCYAQWEDCGPFRVDHFQYVFQNERPKPNLNRGAGLNVSPAVRDYLGLSPTDVTDWQFIEVRDVPPGPWREYGDNNNFVIAKRQMEQKVVQEAPAERPANAAEDRSEAASMKDFEASRQTHLAWELEQKKDYRNAVKLYQDAAAKGNPDAQTNLAKLYIRGKGVPRDDNKAMSLLQKAATQGHEEAQRILSALSAQLEAKKGATADPMWFDYAQDATLTGKILTQHHTEWFDLLGNTRLARERAKALAYILHLDRPISVRALYKDGQLMLDQELNVTEIALHLDEKTEKLAKTAGERRVEVLGKLDHGDNVHHMRPVTMQVFDIRRARRLIVP